MAVVVTLPLFGSPDRELEEKSKVTGTDLRNLGKDLNDRLQKAADLLDRLRAAGWSAQTASYDLMLSHPSVQSKEEAIGRLQGLNVDVEQFLILDEVDEEE
jgi:hypothetical protein